MAGTYNVFQGTLRCPWSDERCQFLSLMRETGIVGSDFVFQELLIFPLTLLSVYSALG